MIRRTLGRHLLGEGSGDDEAPAGASPQHLGAAISANLLSCVTPPDK